MQDVFFPSSSLFVCLMQPSSNQTLVITISEHLQIECDEAFILTIPCLVLLEAKPRGTVRNARGSQDAIVTLQDGTDIQPLL